MRKLIAAVLVLVCIPIQPCRAEEPAARMPRGVWVSVFTQKKVFYSQAAAASLVETCVKAGINEIYLQVYQSGRAYYDSRILERDKYNDMVKSAGADMIDYILKAAGGNNIKVFAWINTLSLGSNESAPVLVRYGRAILTRDQFDRPSGHKNRNETDDYYQREDQVFLEPGDPHVPHFLADVGEEIVTRYPALAGVHLDYIRYPMTVPFIPGSRFSDYGLNYGFGSANVRRFKEETGVDPLKGLGGSKDFDAWDNWRRRQVTAVVQDIARRVKQKNPLCLVSAAVVPSAERAYTAMFQDWPGWLENGLLDYVVLMSYTTDERLMKVLVRSAQGLRGAGKIYAGVGIFLFKDNTEAAAEQCAAVQKLRPDGIVLFAYDDLTQEGVFRNSASLSPHENGQ